MTDLDFIAYCDENAIAADERESYAYELMRDYEEEDLANVSAILNKYSFYYYHVEIKRGYYEGFSIFIENNFGLCYDSFIDKREAQKEITRLKSFLLDCAGSGLVSCSPGYCTKYKDYKNTLADIDAAIRDMRTEARSIPTWTRYNREEGIA